MSFTLSKGINPSKVFIERKTNVTGRWDPFYFRPELVALEKRVRKVTPHRLRKFVRNMAGGATPSTTEAGTHYTESDEGVPFIRVQNLSTTGRLNLDDCKRITRSTHGGLLKRSRLSGGELLVKITGVGRMAVASVVPERFEGNINQHIVAIRTEDIATSETLAAYLNLDMAERLASRRATGGTRPALDYPALLSIPIIFDERIPELMKAAVERHQEQVKKAEALLATIDDVLLDELGIPRKPAPPNTLERRMFQSRSSTILGHRWDPFRYSERQVARRRLVREHVGDFRKLRHCVSNIAAGDWGEDDEDSYDEKVFQKCLVIRNTEFDNAFNLRIENGREKYRLVSRIKLRALKIRTMDLLVEKSGGSIDQPVGRVAILRPEHLDLGPIGYSNFIVKMRAIPSLIDPLFLYYWLRTAHRIGITESMQAQTSGLRNLILEEYFEQDIPVPNPTRQERIVRKLERISDEAKTVRDQARADLEKSKRDIEVLILGKEAAK
jgi:restriction endonuclease S subunit